MQSESLGRWIFAIGKHIAKFTTNAAVARLYATQQAARHGDLLLRIRKADRVTADKLFALALDCGIARQVLALGALVDAGLVVPHPDSNRVEYIDERIFTEDALFRAVAELFNHWGPEPVECALIDLTEMLSGLPLNDEEVFSHMAEKGHDEDITRDAMDIASGFHLLDRKRVGDFGMELNYNDYLWGHKIERIGPILASLGTQQTTALLALMEEIHQAQGAPLDRLTAAPAQIVKLAAQTGIIDTVTIQTASGRDKTFSFSPHFYGVQAGPANPLLIDTADQVKLVVASIEYGQRYSEDFRLRDPQAFLNKLIETGSAGNATPIRRDYILLEKQGIVRTEATSGSKARFILQKDDIVIAARDIMASGDPFGAGSLDPRFLAQQTGFETPEGNRLTGFGVDAPSIASLETDMLAAIREDVQKGRW